MRFISVALSVILRLPLSLKGQVQLGEYCPSLESLFHIIDIAPCLPGHVRHPDRKLLAELIRFRRDAYRPWSRIEVYAVIRFSLCQYVHFLSMDNVCLRRFIFSVCKRSAGPYPCGKMSDSWRDTEESARFVPDFERRAFDYLDNFPRMLPVCCRMEDKTAKPSAFHLARIVKGVFSERKKQPVRSECG